MLFEEFLTIFIVASVVSVMFSLYFFVGLVGQIKKIKVVGSIRKLIGFSIFLTIALFASLLFFGAQGYRGLTDETLVANVIIMPTAEQRYTAIVEFDQGAQLKFELAGDEVMFEANVLKWKPWVQILGLGAAYRMDRIRGRFKNINDERSELATVYSLNDNDSPSFSDWREKYQKLSYLLDVEHGSASYASANSVSRFQLMITNNGLLLRPAE